MNRTVLKIILCVSMLLDHVALMFVPLGSPMYIILRAAGRIAMPLACFFLVEGFLHTSSRIRYGVRLGIFGALAQIPYMYLVAQQNQEYWKAVRALGFEQPDQLSAAQQALYGDRLLSLFNILFTLLVCLIMVCLLDLIRKKWLQKPMPEAPSAVAKKPKTMKEQAMQRATGKPKAKGRNGAVAARIFGFLLCFLVVLVAEVILSVFRFDYAQMAPLLVMVFYLMHDDEGTKLMVGGVCSMIYMGTIPYAVGMLLAFVMIKFYDYEVVPKTKKGILGQLGFYLFYPAHLAVLLGIWMLLA